MNNDSETLAPNLVEYAKLLAEMPLFEGVGMPTIRRLLSRCEEIRPRESELLIRPEQLNDRMLLILSGAVSVHLDAPDSEPLTILGPGECVGEMSLFDGKPPSAYVKVRKPGVMLKVSRELLWDMIDASHRVARNLLHILSERIRSTNQAMTEIQEQKRRHERAASRDGLTGLHNRGWLKRLLSRIEAQSLMPYLPLSVVMLDVDRFKHLNDEYGHQAGDTVLHALGALLQQNIRPLDMLARYGGEEFIILLPNTPRSGAIVLAERLRRLVQECRVESGKEQLPPVTISVGVAVCATVRPVEDVIREADAALYRAKHAGRNCVCY